MKKEARTLGLCLMVFLLAAQTGQAQDLWPMHIDGSTGLAITQPQLTYNNGTLYGTATIGVEDQDLWLASIDEGAILNWQTTHFAPHNQSALACGPRLNGGYVVLYLNEIGELPLSQQQLMLSGISSDSNWDWELMVSDTLSGAELATLTVSDGIAFVVWYGLSGIHCQTYLTTDGSVLPNGSHVMWPAYHYAVTAHGSNFYLAIKDSVFSLDATSGQMTRWGNGQTVLEIAIAATDQGLYVLGCHQNYEIILESFSADTVISTPLGLAGGLPVELRLVCDGTRLIASYSRNGDLFYRVCDFNNSVGAEQILTNAPHYQGYHRLIAADSATVALWFSQDDSLGVVIQHVGSDGLPRWLNGLMIGVMSIASPTPPMGLCSGGAYGWAWWTNNGALLLQPATSATQETGNVQPPRLVPNGLMIANAYPNPFNSTVRISYTVPANGVIVMAVSNVLGQTIATLVNERVLAGHHEVVWSPTTAAGTYFILLAFPEENTSYVKKIIYLP
jgi:hypothetical protein